MKMGKLIGKIKRAIKSPEKIPLNIIYRLSFFKKMDDKKYISLLYKITYNKRIDLDNPKTFNEKLNWLKLNDRNDIYTTMVDKNLAKEYVSNIIGNEYIIPTLGLYDTVDDINVDDLPNQFVMKCNHDSGNVFICRDKSKFDMEKAKKKLSKVLKKTFIILTENGHIKILKLK